MITISSAVSRTARRRRRFAALSVLAAAAVSAGAAAAQERGFDFVAGYGWGESFVLLSETTTARAGKLVGAWEWRFDDGEVIRSRFSAATKSRAKPFLLVGTLEFSMPRNDKLYADYRGLSFVNGVVTVEGSFIGGTGRYENAAGEFRLTARNGVITDGRGSLKLP